MPSYGFHAYWWSPASKPHWYSPAIPATWEHSNISSSSFARHSCSTSTSSHKSFTLLFTWISYNSSQRLILAMSAFQDGFSSSCDLMKSVNVCTSGKRPSHVFQSFFSIAMWVSNQFATCAQSTTDILPLYGISVHEISFAQPFHCWNIVLSVHAGSRSMQKCAVMCSDMQGVSCAMYWCARSMQCHAVMYKEHAGACSDMQWCARSSVVIR